MSKMAIAGWTVAIGASVTAITVAIKKYIELKDAINQHVAAQEMAGKAQEDWAKKRSSMAEKVREATDEEILASEELLKWTEYLAARHGGIYKERWNQLKTEKKAVDLVNQSQEKRVILLSDVISEFEQYNAKIDRYLTLMLQKEAMIKAGIITEEEWQKLMQSDAASDALDDIINRENAQVKLNESLEESNGSLSENISLWPIVGNEMEEVDEKAGEIGDIFGTQMLKLYDQVSGMVDYAVGQMTRVGREATNMIMQSIQGATNLSQEEMEILKENNMKITQEMAAQYAGLRQLYNSELGTMEGTTKKVTDDMVVSWEQFFSKLGEFLKQLAIKLAIIAGVSLSITALTQGQVDFGKAFGIVAGVAGGVGFAKGGRVEEPTLAMIGEGGEGETIIPDSKMPEFIQSQAPQPIINVQTSDPNTFVEYIERMPKFSKDKLSEVLG
jgi:hypothetical protein